MKQKIIITIAFAISLSPMLLSQYGGMRGVQEISGLINLTNPIGLLALVIFLVGVWGPFENKKTGWLFGLIGTIGIVLSELYNYFTWHVLTITGEISLKHSIMFAFPEFYVGLAVSIIMVVVYLVATQNSYK
ncbi:MAG: hypothetical protein IKT62_03260 [Firmicutes bacterium]|nr:hypothetical protein [Bacillota bacterium]